MKLQNWTGWKLEIDLTFTTQKVLSVCLYEPVLIRLNTNSISIYL